MKTGKLRNIDYELVCADGRVVNVVLSADVVRDSAGKFVMGLSVCTDVTQQKRFEAALLESEARFRQAFDSAAHGIALVDLNGNWVDLNEKFCALLGYDRKQLMALNFDAVCHPDDADKDAGLAADLIAGKIASYQSEMRFLHKDDITVPTLLSVGLVRDHQKRPVHFVTQIVDMSALREVEAKYVHAQKMEAVGNLTGGIAHDFNNLLGVILGNMQLLQRRVKDDETLIEFVDAAISATRKGSDLTRHLLAFSRRQELSPQVLNANRLVTSMGEILQRTIGAEIEIATELDDSIPRVKADATQLESAILNLAINARDAMPNGGRLEIKTARVDVGKKEVAIFGLDRPGTYVSITVTDTGEGMSPEIQKTIFEPFFTTKEVGKGSGLGLSMVYGFVTQSGGNIRVYSEPGMGTRFQLLLPSADPDCTPHPVPRPDHQDSETPTGTETILLVEDDPAFRKTAIQLLEDLGYRVISAVDGPGALQAFDATPGIDMVLTDMVMPGGMNGHQLADHLRARAPDLPILLTSGYPRDSFSDGRRYELLQKPYTEKALAHAIRDALAASGGGQARTTP